jgi:AcrR family transcriptional regulator
MMNEPPRIVRKAGEDRRVLRTRRALGTALVELMRAHRFDEITVQQVLDRARVGRATFYAHFRNKHDLLLSDTERYLGWLEERFLADAGTSKRLAPVAELFGHLAEYHHFRRTLEQSSMREAVYDLVTGHLAQIIAKRMAEVCPAPPAAGLPPSATARMAAAALVELMRWWLAHRGQADPREMDARFHAMVWDGLARATPQGGRAPGAGRA